MPISLQPNGAGLLLWIPDKKESNEFTPATDGVDHINVYSKGKTDLGRFLSNFSDTPFTCADGSFKSIEGYWYWLGTNHSNRGELAAMVGWEAKSYGRFLQATSRVRVQGFEDKIKWAIQEKLWAYPQFLRALQECKLPLTHYYDFAGIIKTAPQHNWVIEYLETFKEA